MPRPYESSLTRSMNSWTRVVIRACARIAKIAASDHHCEITANARASHGLGGVSIGSISTPEFNLNLESSSLAPLRSSEDAGLCKGWRVYG